MENRDDSGTVLHQSELHASWSSVTKSLFC
jgi:hypothetical protein